MNLNLYMKNIYYEITYIQIILLTLFLKFNLGNALKC